MAASSTGCSESDVTTAAAAVTDVAATAEDAPSSADVSTDAPDVTDEDTGGFSDPIALSGVTVVPNPNSVLSCFVEWKTEVATTSEVLFGPRLGDATAPTFRFRTHDDMLTLDHRVLVIGLYVGGWDLRAVSTDPSGVGGASDVLRWDTQHNPDGLSDADVIFADRERASDDWILTQIGHGYPWDVTPTTSVMFDTEGHLVWYSPHPLGPVGLSTLVNDGTAVLVAAGSKPREVDLAGNIIWESPGEPVGAYTWWQLKDGSWHHEFSKLPNGNYFVLRTRLGTVSEGRPDWLEEMTPTGETVWRYDTTPINDRIGMFAYGSAASVDLETGQVLFTSRNAAIVAQVNHETLAIDWIAGRNGNVYETGTEEPLFTNPHATTIVGDGNVLLFDDTEPEVGRSGAIEFHIDPITKLAKRLWQYPTPETPDPVWYTPGGGSAQRLENGNTAISSMEGTAQGDFLDTKSVRFIELMPNGDRVLDIALPGAAIMFRAERIPPPQLERLAAGN